MFRFRTSPAQRVWSTTRQTLVVVSSCRKIGSAPMSLKWVVGLAGAATLATTDSSACAPYRHRFYIFFDLGSSSLTPAAQETVREIVARHSHPRCWRISISAHLDSAEAAGAGTDLDERRATAVRDALAALGQTNSEVSAEGFRRPLVVNAIGFQEPQNRRVVIDTGPIDGLQVEWLSSRDEPLTSCGRPFRYVLPDGTPCSPK
jgi:hypothetical protein